MYSKPERHNKPGRPVSEPQEGLAFEVEDLSAAVAWAEGRPGVRLQIKLDCLCISEAIEIYPPGASSPRWFLWRTAQGRLRVDDWGRQKFGLPLTTVEAALRYIGSAL